MMTINKNKMRAVQIHQYGGSTEMKLEEIAIPEPSEGEVLIKVFAAGVNPIDWKIREGYLAEIIPHTLPLTLGWDFSGEIVSLGENVNKWSIGDAVYARPDFSKNGAYADYIVVSEDEIAVKPKILNWQKSATVPLVTLTAWQALKDIGEVKQGDRVKAGDNLLMIEAMKMNHIVKANEDGVIAELFVQENDQLDYGAVLMIIEPKG